MDNGKLDLLTDLLLDSKKTLNNMQGHIAEIQADLAFHIARTTQLEDRAELVEKELKSVHKDIYRFNGALSLLVVLATIASIYKSLGK